LTLKIRTLKSEIQKCGLRSVWKVIARRWAWRWWTGLFQMIGSWNINPSLIWSNWTDFTLNRSFHFTSFLFFKWLVNGTLDDSAARSVTVSEDNSTYQPVLKLPNQFSISTFHLGSYLVPFQLLPKSLIEPYSIVFLVHFVILISKNLIFRFQAS